MWIVNVEFRSFIKEVDEQEKLRFRKEQLENNQILRAEKTLVQAVSDLRGTLDGRYEQELDEVVATARTLREEALGVLNRLDDVEKTIGRRSREVRLSRWRRSYDRVHLP